MARQDVTGGRPTAAGALAEVSRALTSSRPPRDVFDLILAHVCALVGAPKALLVQVGADERIRVIASRGLATPLRELRPAHDRDGLAMTVITERRTVWSADISSDPAIRLSADGRAVIEREGFRAELGVPLLGHAGVLGALVACRAEVGRFAPDEIEVTEALAALATVALERGRLDAIEVARLRQDQALVDIEREMLAELSTERLFPLLLERAGLLVNARGTIYVAEPGRQWLRRAWSTWLQGSAGLRIGEGISGVCAETRRGILVADYPTWAKAHGAYVGLGVRTAIAQPLLSRGELLGVVTMSRTAPEAPPFEPGDLAILQRFARQAALALRNATLYEQAEQRRSAAQELARLARTLSDRQDAARLGEEIVRSVRGLLVDCSCTLRVLAADGSLVVVASQEFEPGHRQPTATGLTARVIAEGRALWSSDLLEEPGLVYEDELRRRIESLGIRAALVVPLRTERGVLGVFQVGAREVREFSAHEVELAQAFADQAALALEGARLYGAVRDSEARYRDLFENSNDAMVTTSLDGTFTTVNRAMEAMLGWSRAEAIGQHYGLAATPERVAEWVDRTRRALAGERLPRIWETEMRHKSGRTIPVECRTRLVRDPSGKPIGIEGTVRDITTRKEIEAALRQAKEAAESASRAKTSFLANMSHELRTPLNAILGYAQLLQRDRGLDPRQEKALAVIEQSGEHLLGLINEILDLAKIEAGSLAVQATTFDLPRLLEGIAAMVRDRAEGKRLGFAATWSPDVPVAVHTDERWLRQVLVNLLDNAIKYTDRGGVTLTVARHGERVRFLVEDTGIGIRPEDLTDIFEAFHQVRDARRVVEGAGLGLAISKTLVGLLGGSLEVTSRPGEGSRFWFDLDLPEVSADGLDAAYPRRRVTGIAGMRRRVLVADDREDNRRLLRDLLVPAGFEVREATSGEQCLAAVRAEPPDAILLDLRMPDMDGFEVTRRVRAGEGQGRIVIVAVSASAFEHHREQCLEAGADDFIAKPFRVEKLLDLLCRHLGLEPIYDGAAPASPADAGEADAPPPGEELAELVDLARRGNVRRILQCAARLDDEGRHPRFAAELRRLAERFQVKQLCQFLETAGRRA